MKEVGEIQKGKRVCIQYMIGKSSKYLRKLKRMSQPSGSLQEYRPDISWDVTAGWYTWVLLQLKLGTALLPGATPLVSQT